MQVQPVFLNLCGNNKCYSMYDLIQMCYSNGIASVVDGEMEERIEDPHDAPCFACEMSVMWIQNQIKRNKTEEQILSYVNEV